MALHVAFPSWRAEDMKAIFQGSDVSGAAVSGPVLAAAVTGRYGCHRGDIVRWRGQEWHVLMSSPGGDDRWRVTAVDGGTWRHVLAAEAAALQVAASA